MKNIQALIVLLLSFLPALGIYGLYHWIQPETALAKALTVGVLAYLGGGVAFVCFLFGICFLLGTLLSNWEK